MARESLALSPRSPKHTIQVSAMNRGIGARIVCRKAVRRHEEQPAGKIKGQRRRRRRGERAVE
jgi:hypothetical protein